MVEAELPGLTAEVSAAITTVHYDAVARFKLERARPWAGRRPAVHAAAREEVALASR